MSNGKTIVVDAAELESAARVIHDKASSYKSAYQKLLSEVRGMGKAWSGVDNAAFVDKVNSFEDDMRTMEMLMNDYADFLERSARAYKETQAEIERQARALPNGR